MNEALQVILSKTESREEPPIGAVASFETRFGLSRPAFIGGYTVACDGHRMLAVVGDFTEGVTPHEKFPTSAITKWLSETPETTATVNADEFVAAVRLTSVPQQCGRCEGRAREWSKCERCDEEHDCACKYCDDGMVPVKARTMLLGPEVINANLISDVFAVLKPTGALNISVIDEESRITIRGEGFVFIMMPMRYVKTEGLTQLLPEVKA